MIVERDYYTPADVAYMLGVSDHCVYVALHEGRIPACRVGARWIIPKKRFAEWRASGENLI